MDRFEGCGGNLRQPEATRKRRLPQSWGQNINNIERSEATEATFGKASHVREGKRRFLPYREGVGKGLPRLPQFHASGCAKGAEPEATAKPRLPQVAPGWGA